MKTSKNVPSQESQISSPSHSECSSLTTLSELRAKPSPDEPEDEPETVRLGKRKLALPSEKNKEPSTQKKNETANKTVAPIEASSSDHIDQPDSKKLRLMTKVLGSVEPSMAVGSQIVKRQPLKVKKKYGGKRRGSSSPSSNKSNVLQFDIIPHQPPSDDRHKEDKVTEKIPPSKQRDKPGRTTRSERDFSFKFPVKSDKSEVHTSDIPAEGE